MKTGLLIFLFALLSCKVSVGTNESQQFKSIPLMQVVDYSALKTYVLTPHCLRCHAWAGSEAGIQQRMISQNPEGSIIYQKIKDGSMPPSSALSTRYLELVEKYINTAQMKPTVPLNSTFKSIQFHLIERSCLSCHNNQSKEVSFEGYAKIRKKASAIMDALDYGEAEGSPMPPINKYGKREAPVPTSEIVEAFRKWIEEGKQNN